MSAAIDCVSQEKENDVPVNTSPLKFISLRKEFAKHLSHKAFDFFKRKGMNTVQEYYITTQGKLIFDEDFMIAGDTGANFELRKRLHKLLMELDVKMTREGSICLFGGLTVSVKYKDREKLDDEIALVKLAEIYNKLVEDGYVLPIVFPEETPMKLQLALMDNDNVYYPKEDGKVVKMKTATYYAMKHKQTISRDEQVILQLEKYINDFEREYTDEEVNELNYRMLYCLWLFPTKKFEEAAKEKCKTDYAVNIHYNQVIGLPFFNSEGAIPQMIINL